MKFLPLCVLVMGEESAMKGNIIFSIISLVLGVIVGELLDLDGKLNNFANSIKEKFISVEEDKFAEGFISAILIFCVGSMTILGSIDAGLKGGQWNFICQGNYGRFHCLFPRHDLWQGRVLSSPSNFYLSGDFSFPLRLFGTNINAWNSCKLVGHRWHYDYCHLPFHVKTCWLQNCKFTSSNFCPHNLWRNT